MQQKRSRLTAILALILSVFSLFAALYSIFDKSIYDEVIATGLLSKSLMPGTFSQDVISIFAALFLAALSIIYLLHPNHKVFISIIGLAGYFFYAYGLFATAGLYTSIYPIYLVIFGLSIYGMILGLTSFEVVTLGLYSLQKSIRVSISVFLLVIVAMFVPLWVSALMPSALIHVRPDAYGVYVLDLCIVMPALAITAGLLLKNKPFGNVMAGVALVKVLSLILSVTIGEALAPVYGIQSNIGMIGIYGVIVIVSLVIGALYMMKLQKVQISGTDAVK